MLGDYVCNMNRENIAKDNLVFSIPVTSNI